MEDSKIKNVLAEEIQHLEKMPEIKRYLSYKAALAALNYSFEDLPSSNGNHKPEKLTSAKSTDDSPSTKQVVASIFKEHKRFLHIREILDIAKKTFPNQDLGSIRQSVYGLRGDKVIVGYAVNGSNQNVFWGSPSWLNEDKQPKPEFMYDKTQLSTNKKENIEI